MSGYTYCSCRDCMDVGIDGMCWACEEAGCIPQGESGASTAYAINAYEECQREDAYGQEG